MRRFEDDPQQITASLVRYNRGMRLMKNNVGKITIEMLMGFLSDHINYPLSICRHGSGVKTTFSVVINLDTLTMYLARGNPCEAEYAEYNLLATN
jgi:isopenicillin-N N-acyltransferase-like protein